MTYKILQIGCGNMGAAIAQTFKYNLKSYKSVIIDPKASIDLCDQNIKLYQNREQVEDFAANIVIFAVKPQMITEVIEEFQDLISADAIVISILAGTKLEVFKSAFPNNQIVRVMPNLGAKIGMSINLAYSDSLTDEAKENVNILLNSFGYTAWLQNEEQLHAGTAVAGSGPAYYFFFIKLYANYLEKAGYTKQESQNIAAEVANASAKIAKSDPNLEQLIKDVTSKGGTTEAALTVLKEEEALERLIESSLDAAAQRSKDLC